MVTDILAEHGILFLGSRLKRLADRMQADATEVLERLELGVQPSQVTLLTALDRFGPLTVTEMVKALGTSQPAVTRLAAGLVEAGLVSADRSAQDQRQKTIDFTTKGREVMERIRTRLWPPVRLAAEGLTAGLSGAFLEQVETLEANLDRRSLTTRVEDARRAKAEDMPATLPGLRIVEYSDALAPAFAEITREWVEAHFTLEENDRRIIENPRAMILERGGFILFVEADGLGIVGTCALIKIEDGVFELTKMGVRPSARGRKAGEFLLRAVLNRAEAMGLDELFLLTNAKLAAAVHLYEKAGFCHDPEIMRRYGGRYARANVAMRYPLPEKSLATAEAAVVRPARGPVDLAAAAQLFRDYAADVDLDLTSQDFDAELAGLPSGFASPRGELFLAFDPDGTPVGCAGLRAFGPERCELKRLFVRPGTRGAGLGRRLLEAAIAFATAAGYREMLLESRPQMTAAIALYERRGFERIPPYPPNVIPDAIYFGRKLSALQ